MILISTILFGLARGLYEGMVMYQPGVRSHVAFWTYHALGIAVFVIFGRLVYLVMTSCRHWAYMIGIAFVLWECTELGYSIARIDMPFFQCEHVAIGDLVSIYLIDWQVWAIHVARIAVAVTLLLVKSKRRGVETPVLFV